MRSEGVAAAQLIKMGRRRSLGKLLNGANHGAQSICIAGGFHINRGWHAQILAGVAVAKLAASAIELHTVASVVRAPLYRLTGRRRLGVARGHGSAAKSAPTPRRKPHE